MSLHDRLRGMIAATHGWPGPRHLARVAEQYLNAYNNVGNWDMNYNGELRALKHIASRIDGDVLDVGANVGQWASSVLPFLGNKRLHCFELVPTIFAQLQNAIPAGPNVILNPFGLGRQRETVQVNYSAQANTISSIYPLVYEAADQITVAGEIVPGDEYLAEHGITQVSVLKIDVEGMEMETLAGFENSIRDGRIATVQFEHGPSHVHSGHTLKTFVDFFDEFGLDVYHVLPARLIPLKYSLESENFAGHNFFAVRREMKGLLALG